VQPTKVNIFKLTRGFPGRNAATLKLQGGGVVGVKPIHALPYGWLTEMKEAAN
jgi:hypothetical protein